MPRQKNAQNALIVLANTISHIPSIGTSGHVTTFAITSFGHLFLREQDEGESKRIIEGHVEK
jgi:hypothetical protein